MLRLAFARASSAVAGVHDAVVDWWRPDSLSPSLAKNLLSTFAAELQLIDPSRIPFQTPLEATPREFAKELCDAVLANDTARIAALSAAIRRRAPAVRDECPVCSSRETRDEVTLVCAVCEQRYHFACAGITPAEADALPHNTWYCDRGCSAVPRHSRGAFVVFKRADGTVGHCTLERFIAVANLDGSLYAGLARAIAALHYPVFEDAVLNEDGTGPCMTLHRIFAALHVAWAASPGFHAMILTDSVLRVAAPDAVARDAAGTINSAAWKAEQHAFLKWFFAPPGAGGLPAGTGRGIFSAHLRHLAESLASCFPPRF